MTNQQSLVILKPDAVKRNLIGRIIERFEKNNLVITAMKMIYADEEQLKKHYKDDEDYIIQLGKKSAEFQGVELDYKEEGKMIINSLRKYLMAGPVVVMVIEGEYAVQKIRKLVGSTDPAHAEKGTIRGDFGIDSIEKSSAEKRAVHNLIHASGTEQEAEEEINLWFPEGVCKKTE